MAALMAVAVAGFTSNCGFHTMVSPISYSAQLAAHSGLQKGNG